MKRFVISNCPLLYVKVIFLSYGLLREVSLYTRTIQKLCLKLHNIETIQWSPFEYKFQWTWVKW